MNLEHNSRKGNCSDLEFLADLVKSHRRIGFFREAQSPASEKNEEPIIFEVYQVFGNMQDQVWPASIRLAQYMVNKPVLEILSENGSVTTRRRAIELGSGLGLVSKLLSTCGLDVVATDIRVHNEIPNRVVLQNGDKKDMGSLKWIELDWQDFERSLLIAQQEGPFDYILGSDLVFDKRNFHWLARTLQTFLFAFKNSECYISTQIRDREKETDFFDCILPKFNMKACEVDVCSSASLIVDSRSSLTEKLVGVEFLSDRIIQYTRIHLITAEKLVTKSQFSNERDGIFL